MRLENLPAVQKLAAGIVRPVALELADTGDERAGPMRSFLEEMAAAVPEVTYRRVEAPEGAPPAIRVPGGVEFLCVPAGAELEPFLSLLALTSDGGLAEDALVRPHRDRIGAITAPCPIRLHISRHCPHCPKAVTLWSRIAAAGPHLRLQVIESERFPELTRSDGVRSVPTLVFDRALRWTGSARPEVVLPVLADQDPARLDAGALESLIRDGQAAELARTMQRRNCLFPSLFELLTHPKWPVRLGAMVVMETLAETDPALASGAVAPLLGAFEGLDTQAKGDVLYVLGETGDADVLPFIEKTAEDAAGELKSAAEDAIDRIRRRTANPGKGAP